MRVLALDTALGATSAAIVDFPGGVRAMRSLPMARGHAEALTPLVRDLAGEVEGGLASLTRIVTTVGPGSFTGLRVAVAAARAFGLALEVPVVGVSALTAYAAPLLSAGPRAVIAAAIDARHGSVFFHSFWLDGKTAFGPAIVTLEEAAQRLSGGRSVVVGNAAEAVAAVARGLGHASEAHGQGQGLGQGLGQEQAAAPDILWVARLGAAADPAYAPALPLYLKGVSAAPSTGGRVARA